MGSTVLTKISTEASSEGFPSFSYLVQNGERKKPTGVNVNSKATHFDILQDCNYYVCIKNKLVSLCT